MIFQRTFENQEIISRTVQEHFNVLRKDENKFPERQQ